MLVQFCMMVVLRGHYSIDLVAGLIFAHYFFIIARHIAPYFDQRICRMNKDQIKKYRREQFPVSLDYHALVTGQKSNTDEGDSES